MPTINHHLIPALAITNAHVVAELTVAQALAVVIGHGWVVLEEDNVGIHVALKATCTNVAIGGNLFQVAVGTQTHAFAQLG